MTHMNNANRAINEKSLTTVTFLDVTIQRKEQPHPTISSNYMSNLTTPPRGTFKGVIIGEVIRFRRTNSKATEYLETQTQITEKGIPHQPHQQTLESNHIP